jgi:hypothetical protein
VEEEERKNGVKDIGKDGKDYNKENERRRRFLSDV